MSEPDENAKESDPPFHFEIWRGPSEAFNSKPRSIYYVENHNGHCGYSDLATDFELAALEIIRIYRETQLGNWMGPTAHLVRQTLELLLKTRVETIHDTDSNVGDKILKSHNLESLWVTSLSWLENQGYEVRNDARLSATQHLLSAYHAIDPTGDLFRFGISYQTAFEKRKSYDRVGIVLENFEAEFDASIGFFRHWEAVVRRKKWAEEEGWERDELFDANEFPRKIDDSAA
jgi:hypothetical protein